MARELWLGHRGQITGLVAVGDTLVLGTAHPEGLPGALHALDADSGKLQTWPVAAGVAALAARPGGYVAAGADGQLHWAEGASAPTARGACVGPALALAAVGDGVAVLSAEALEIVGADGAARQRLALSGPASALAASADGRWLAVGLRSGALAVFSAEDGPDFVAGDEARIHEGPVRALVFEREGLRILSTGADGTLRLTHARGRLDSEDRGGKAGHAAVALVGSAERLYSLDAGEIKAWPWDGKRPQSWSDGVGSARFGAVITLRGRPHLAVATEAGDLRLFLLDAAGKVDHRALIARDAYASAAHGLASARPAERLATLDTLAGYDDAAALDLLAKAASEDADHGLRVAAVERLGRSGHPKAGPALEARLRDRAEGVRLAALAGLRAQQGPAQLAPLDLALAAGTPDLGLAAVEALAGLAARDADARQRLEASLEHRQGPVRLAALAALAGLGAADDPAAELLGLSGRQADVRFAAVQRLHQRGLAAASGVPSALRRAQEDPDARVAQAALQVQILAVPALAEALRARDADLHRQLHAIETWGQAEVPEPPRTRKKKFDLDDAARRPLLEALAARSLASCVAGARGLALLGDPRAFGALLQLSREGDVSARVAACQALEVLADPRALPRLRQLLRDDQASVRDAAFSALLGLHGDARLEAVDAGFEAPHDDVRQRALRALVTPLRKAGPLDPASPEAARLAAALDGPSAPLRSEAYKAALNLGVGDLEQTQRFALRSRHPDVRRAVLDELLAQLNEAWAWPLLLTLLADPDPGLRQAAFTQASRKARGRTPKPATVALDSPFADLRRLGARALAERPDAAALARLAQATHDPDAEVRLTALAALEEAWDEAALRAAADSPHADVRTRAAAARAARGDASVLGALQAPLAEPAPEDAEPRARWVKQITLALDGLAALEASEATAAVIALLDAPEPALRQAAAACLAWIAPAAEPLLGALRHADPAVQREAALGLARLGDPRGAAALPAEAPAKGRRAPDLGPARLALEAALALHDADRLTALLEHADDGLRGAAQLALVLWAWRRPKGASERSLAALSTGDPGVRLRAAEVLERLGDPAGLAELAGQALRDASGGRARSAEAAATLADALAAGGRLAARALPLIQALPQDDDETFARRLGAFQRRWSTALAAGGAPSAPVAALPDLDAVVFGAYAALSRLGDRSAQARNARRTALRRLAELAARGRASAEALAPVLLPALGDPAQPVREAAFEALLAAGLSADVLAAEALATGHADLGRAGLTLLIEAPGAAGVEVLSQAIRQRTDGLQSVAYELLIPRAGALPAARLALSARDARLRQLALQALERRWAEGDDEAVALLRAAAATHPERGTRLGAARILAWRQDAAVREPLLALIAEADRDTQRRAAESLVHLGDPSAADGLVARISDDRAGTADIQALLGAVGRLRAGPVDALLALLGRPAAADAAWQALLRIAGADHRRPDEDDPPAVQAEEYAKLTREHRLDDALVARLLGALTPPADSGRADDLLPAARWARDAAVDAPLATWATGGSLSTRARALEAIGWRLAHRAGPAAPLLAALRLPEPQLAFVAARGLALAGQGDGLGILRSTVELGERLDDRRAAVDALGVLGDLRALDPLLALAESDGHALQEAAAEALGRLAQEGPARERAFPLLARLAGLPGGWDPDGVACRALRGLRWIGGVEAWAIIRGRMADENWVIRAAACRLLAHDPGEAASELLGARLRVEEDFDVAEACALSLRERHGPDSLVPDLAIARSAFEGLEEDTCERLAARATPAELFALLAEVQDWDTYGAPVADALRARAGVADALPALGALDGRVAQLAAQVVGSAPPDPAAGEAIAAALPPATEAWRAARRAGDAEATTDRGAVVARLVWAAGRQGVAADAVTALALTPEPGEDARAIRRAALTALAGGLGAAAAGAALRTATTAADAESRALAAAGLAQRDAAAAAAAAPDLLDDAEALAGLLALGVDAHAALATGARSAHLQGVVLPHLVAAAEVGPLAAIAGDRALDEATRLGAIEALARVPRPESEAPLRAVAAHPDEDDALRKAAWRAVRRLRRSLEVQP